VMGWSTSVVAPPDGSMRDYMASLEKLRARPEQVYLPGHGPALREGPRYVRHFIAHRKAREAAILRHLPSGQGIDIPSLVQAIYVGLDPRLVRAAGLSIMAHLEDLVARGLAATDGEPAVDGRYRAAD
jgi:glyoxylase-like metal-dependent hydrolase (beta-lactamase superfamily II)